MRFIISALVSLELDADDAEAAYEQFADGLDEIEGLRDVVVNHVDQKEKPFHVPSGAERWGIAAKAIRFDDNYTDRGDGRRIWGECDGSWWWTNGHTALRCEGPAPVNETVWRGIPDADFEKAVAASAERREGTWGAMRPLGSSFACALEGSTSIALDARYRSLVEGSVNGVRWLVGDSVMVPIHAVDPEGKLVAVVMGMRLGLELAT